MKDNSVILINSQNANNRYLKDVWLYRELLFFLAWRDVLVRYKQTVIGILWAVVRPLITIVVFTVIFGSVAKMPSGGVPYAILVCTAMLPWQFFSGCLQDVSNSVINNSNIVTKIYFPRIVLPLSATAVCFVDFAISACILVGLMLWYNVPFGWTLLYLPIFIVLAAVFSFSLGVFFCSLNVKFRDFRYIIPFIIQIGLYISPVGFSSAVVPDEYRLLFSLNPMVTIIEGFRYSILGKSHFYILGACISACIVLLLLIMSFNMFKKMERTIADII